MLRYIKIDWWQKVIVKSQVLIMRNFFASGHDQVHQNTSTHCIIL